MGLFDLEGTDPEEYPDNKGGRPPKDGEDENLRKPVQGDANIDGDEEYWERIWGMFYTEDKPINEVVSEICGYTYSLPNTVINDVQEYEIYDFYDHIEEFPDWEDYLEHEMTSEKKTENILGSLGGDSSGGSDSGLAGLVNESKDG